MKKEIKVTTQRTSKKLKLIKALSAMTMICSFLMIVIATELENEVMSSLFTLSLMTGLGGYVYSRFAIWWNHE